MIPLANEIRLKTLFFEILFNLYWIFNLEEISLKTQILGFDSFQYLTLESHNSLSRTPFLVF